ncbi:hypothetical protein SDRG_16688 [Saprolegnia diclina VS20]|uniref:Uncharacterized protein n=1 Tax=Saprolegnia diclina (strain VS20) TaxID=1156394 RepID=T0R7I5_SAPDV|nr:hypothetical protein SDRG_16688 [Saprolegnia diclina VS20]EQC25442.1 hypothetical protein SDRG_16688 [Saprolegnia diclina VS20]|eukprot:XP_008621128.1 hypothetical protein SDRG_16688 [Saprolegnia diclina VS20]
MTPLCLAAHLSREAIVGMLLIANANPNQSNGLGQTPLSIAATTGDVGIVEMLLQDGADVNATDKTAAHRVIPSVPATDIEMDVSSPIYGTTHKGTYHGRVVAIKTPVDESSVQAILHEMETIQQ